jgi:hypothetical protein
MGTAASISHLNQQAAAHNKRQASLLDFLQ